MTLWPSTGITTRKSTTRKASSLNRTSTSTALSHFGAGLKEDWLNLTVSPNPCLELISSSPSGGLTTGMIYY